MRISDWSSDVCSSDLYVRLRIQETPAFQKAIEQQERVRMPMMSVLRDHPKALVLGTMMSVATFVLFYLMTVFTLRSEEHTSELQSLMRISYAVFCLKKKKYIPHT